MPCQSHSPSCRSPNSPQWGLGAFSLQKHEDTLPPCEAEVQRTAEGRPRIEGGFSVSRLGVALRALAANGEASHAEEHEKPARRLRNRRVPTSTRVACRGEVVRLESIGRVVIARQIGLRVKDY